MSPKAQHAVAYKKLPLFLRSMREQAGLTQRDLGKLLRKPQSWIQNCETASRRVDVTEFVAWAKACGLDAQKAFAQFLDA